MGNNEMGKSLINLLMLPYPFCVRVLPSCIILENKNKRQSHKFF